MPTRPTGPHPLTCVLRPTTANVRIDAASATDPTGKTTALAVAGDGQSFEVPLATPGTFSVSAVLNDLPSGASLELDAADTGEWLADFVSPATLSTDFILVVKP